MKKTFVATFRVDGQYKAIVEADVVSDDLLQITEEELDKIKDLAEIEFNEADFGKLNGVIYYQPQMVEEFDTGSVVWCKE